MLDVDIQSFFDTLDRAKLRELLGQRVADGVVVRLVGKWLHAGVLDGEILSHSDTGTPQGGVLSPLLANIYLHEALDRWWVEQVQPRLETGAHLVRYVDDLVIVTRTRRDAERVQAVLPQRFAKYGLTLHPEKTRLLRFWRPPRKGKGPGSFDFLGFTFYWGRSRKGNRVLKQKTMKSRLTRAITAVDQWLRRVRHLPVKKQVQTLRRKLRGHYNYYGIRNNSKAIGNFLHAVTRRWKYWLGHRSQRARMTWEKFNRLLRRYPLPPARLPRRRRQQRLANL